MLIVKKETGEWEAPAWQSPPGLVTPMGKPCMDYC